MCAEHSGSDVQNSSLQTLWVFAMPQMQLVASWSEAGFGVSLNAEDGLDCPFWHKFNHDDSFMTEQGLDC